MIIEYTIEFYSAFYNEIYYKDFDPDRNYFQELTERDKV